MKIQVMDVTHFQPMNITTVNVRNFWEIHDFEYLVLHVIKPHSMLSERRKMKLRRNFEPLLGLQFYAQQL